MTQKEINDFKKRVEIMPGETTTYFNYVYYETIIKFEAENNNEISFEVRRAFTAPYMKFGFYMIIDDDPIPVLLSSDAVDAFMMNPYKAEKLALEVAQDRKNFKDARWSVHLLLTKYLPCAIIYLIIKGKDERPSSRLKRETGWWKVSILRITLSELAYARLQR